MLVNVKKEDFYYSEDEIKQLATDYGLLAVKNKEGYYLYVQDAHFSHNDSSDRLVMAFYKHSKDGSILLLTAAYPNIYLHYDKSLYTQEAEFDDDGFGKKIFPKWTLVNTDPFLKKIFDYKTQVLRKTEAIRILGEFTRNVKLCLQKEKIAKIKEAAAQYSM